ncbi:MAG: 50S ribosomal protein P1 [Thermoplasmata archaeon HGW-Thermoplasmata-1]|nr:MAG: 50S ribosomal protein P1 [Thermoplasmata archaeon HGW-Thermoplasmata-1]
MEYIYGAMLLHSAGKAITEDAITKILAAVGVEVEASRVKALVASLEGVDIEAAVKTAVAAPAAAPAAAAAVPAAAKKEEKKEEVEEEVSEEDAAAGLGALFG